MLRVPAIDHAFLCTAPGAPAAQVLIDFGLAEGPPNRHPGQGTANRRFFFRNFMLELIWVADPEEAQSERTHPTRLWDRWSAPVGSASPFGIILCTAAEGEPCPFPSWRYAPPTMPGLELDIACGTDLHEPMWCYMNSRRPPRPVAHAAGLTDLTALRLAGPPPARTSVTTAMARHNVISLTSRDEYVIELEFDNQEQQRRTDFRPALPLIFVF